MKWTCELTLKINEAGFGWKPWKWGYIYKGFAFNFGGFGISVFINVHPRRVIIHD